MKTIQWLALIGICITLTACERIQLEPFSHKDGKFTVMAPGPMTYSEHTASSPIGKLKMHAFMKPIGNRLFMLSYNDYPPLITKFSTPKKMLQGAAKGAIKKFKPSKIISQKSIKLGNVPGLAFHAHGVRKTMKLDFYGRFFVKGSRLYQVIVAQKRGLSKDIALKYIQSFQITAPPKK